MEKNKYSASLKAKLATRQKKNYKNKQFAGNLHEGIIQSTNIRLYALKTCRLSDNMRTFGQFSCFENVKNVKNVWAWKRSGLCAPRNY